MKLDNNEMVIGICLNVKKALDSVNHDLILRRLEYI